MRCGCFYPAAPARYSPQTPSGWIRLECGVVWCYALIETTYASASRIAFPHHAPAYSWGWDPFCDWCGSQCVSVNTIVHSPLPFFYTCVSRIVMCCGLGVHWRTTGPNQDLLAWSWILQRVTFSRFWINPRFCARKGGFYPGSVCRALPRFVRARCPWNGATHSSVRADKDVWDTELYRALWTQILTQRACGQVHMWTRDLASTQIWAHPV